MARTRMQLGAAGDARLKALTKAGGTAESVAATLTAEGWPISRATVGNRMKELRGEVRRARKAQASGSPAPAAPPSAATPALPLPSEPEDIPEGATLTQLDRWIVEVEGAIETAKADEDLKVLGQMLRVAAFLGETRRKATPPVRPDPNDAPDMVKLGAEVKERLHKMVDLVVGAPPGWLPP